MNRLEGLKPLALLLLRLALGVIFIYNGYPKLFTRTAQAVQGMQHAGLPSYFAYIAGALELFGGILLILGLFTRIAGLLLAGEMVVALWRVHIPQGGIYAVKNYEFPMALAAAAFVLATLGAGVVSLDHPIWGRRPSPSRRYRKL